MVRTRETAEFAPDPLMVGVVFMMKGGLPPWDPVQISLINRLLFSYPASERDQHQALGSHQ